MLIQLVIETKKSETCISVTQAILPETTDADQCVAGGFERHRDLLLQFNLLENVKQLEEKSHWSGLCLPEASLLRKDFMSWT